MNTKKLLGQKIKEFRKLRDFTQDKLSELIGIEPKHLSRIEVGKSYPSLDTLEKIAKALDIEIRNFFEFESLEKSPKEIKKSINSLLKELDREKLYSALLVLREIIK